MKQDDLVNQRTRTWQKSLSQGLVVLLGCVSLLACGRNEAREAESGPSSRTASASRTYSQDELAALYPSVQPYDVCVDDASCDAPLRCMSGECRFPPAMTGERHASTPYLEIQTEQGTRRYALELALSVPEQARGMMFREHMQPDWGMLFIFPVEKRQSFWMKNTLLPLDMIFIRKDGVIDSIIENAEPRSLVARESRGTALYVLELRGGESRAAGIRRGDTVSFVGLPTAESL